jgi:ribosome-binding ATPase YchF (GTP1/OBG family)
MVCSFGGGFVAEATPVDTLQNQFSGYGSNAKVVAKVLDELGLKEPLENWSEETIEKVVNKFVDVKFPTVIALNKIDHPDADKNIAKISKMYPNAPLVLTSSISEVFLRRLAKQGYVKYVEGGDVVDTREDLIADGDVNGGGLKEMDEKLKNRLENLKDLVLYRFGSTGVVQVLTKAAEILGLVPVFPVKNIGNFSDGGKAFRDCVLVKKGITISEVYRKVMGDAPLAYVEAVGGLRVSEDDEVKVGKNDVSLMRSNKDETLLSYVTDIVFQSWPCMKASRVLR